MIRLQNGCKNWFVVFKKNRKLIWYATGSPDEKKARQKELELKSEISKKRDADRLKSFIERMTGEKITDRGMLIDSAWSYYRDDYCKDQAKTSVKRKELDWKAFLEWLGKGYPEKKFLHEIDYKIAKEYGKKLEQDIKSGHYFNLKIAIIRSIFKHLHQQAEMQNNPFDNSIIKSKQKDNISYKTLNDAEITAILDKCNPAWKTACTIALHTGLDFANTRNLRWDELREIETDNGTRLVIETVRKKTEKKLKGKKLHIPVHKELEKHLHSLKHEGIYILPDRFRTRNIEGEFPAILKEVKIQADGCNLGFHCWRHTCNARLQAEGVAVDTRQKLMGHTSMEINLTYSNDMKQLFKAVDGMRKSNEVRK